MQWHTSNSQNALITFNGPYLIQTTGNSIVHDLRAQTIQLVKPVDIGETIIYGNSTIKKTNEDSNSLES